MFRSNLKFFVVFLIIPMILSACLRENAEDLESKSPEAYFEGAEQVYKSGKYNKSGALFADFERFHPYSERVGESLIRSTEVYYEGGYYDEAIGIAQRYISIYPASDNTAYARYLIALCYYQQVVDLDRDQVATERLSLALQEVIHRFPSSEYARDAELKLKFAYDQLAGTEIERGRYYLNRGSYAAAAKRFQTVVEQYQMTSHVPEALYRLIEVYLLLGVVPEAQRIASVLGYNYQSSSWYQEAYDLFKKYELLIEVTPVDDDNS
jgi:outer membrane protein assembly factor BamD